jgi:hypothetical protein
LHGFVRQLVFNGTSLPAINRGDKHPQSDLASFFTAAVPNLASGGPRAAFWPGTLPIRRRRYASVMGIGVLAAQFRVECD